MRVRQRAVKSNNTCIKPVTTQFSQAADGIFDRTFDQTFN